jgi:formyl-CoA transferase
VLDLSGYVAGPYGCALLGDLGALVIKIEPPEGDNLRNYPSTLPGESRAFLGVNRNKRGIGLDLKHPDGVGVLRRMVERADVLVHNFRPSVPARLGVDYDQMDRVNPRLIYCALTGYGDTGPLKERAGYDQVLQTMTGICVEQGKPGDPEIVYGSAVDFYSASMLAFAVSSALFERSRTGRGQYVSVSLLRSALTMQAIRLVWADGEGRDVARDVRSGGITGLHPTKHGSLYLSANTPHFWKALCELTGLTELASDPRFDTVRKRAEHAALLVPRLRAALQARTAVEWEALLGERVPCAAARPVEDMFDHPQVAAEGILASFEHPGVGRYRGMAHPVRFGAGPPPAPFAAPQLGQHSREILAGLGYSDEEIERLCGAGAVVGPVKRAGI